MLRNLSFSSFFQGLLAKQLAGLLFQHIDLVGRHLNEVALHLLPKIFRHSRFGTSLRLAKRQVVVVIWQLSLS